MAMNIIARLIRCEHENLCVLTADIRDVMRMHLTRMKCDELARLDIELSLPMQARSLPLTT